MVAAFLAARPVQAGGRAAGTTSSVSFTAGEQIPLGVGDVGVQGISLEDLNEDGSPDLVAIDQFTGGVSILINQGNGTFSAPMSITLDVLPTAVVAADFSGDDIPEIAVSDFDGGVSLVERNDAGEFVLVDQIDPGVELVGITAGDLDNDDDLDLIVLETSDEVVLQQNDGFGNFECFEEDILDTDGEDPVDVDVGDFNRDGAVDIVVLNRLTENVSLLLGHGDGLFDEVLLFPVGADPRDLVVGRVDADDIDDLLVIDSGFFGDDNVTVLLGRPDGQFARPPRALAEVGSSAIGLADFDGDGCQDFVAPSEEENVPLVALGDCAGGFSDPVATAALGAGRAIDVGDLNDDGKTDFITLEALGERLRPAFNQTVPPQRCPGDCDGGGEVTIDELVTAVNIVLEVFQVSECEAADFGGDGTVTIDDLVRAVNAVLGGCPAD